LPLSQELPLGSRIHSRASALFPIRRIPEEKALINRQGETSFPQLIRQVSFSEGKKLSRRHHSVSRDKAADET
jgi:hypothetical protein